ncbi:MAG: MASE3 domain-containing protein [Spirochaetota bacterium]
MGDRRSGETGSSLREGFRRGTELLAGVLVLTALFFTAQRNYLLFHSLGELFSVAVGFAIFMMAWNARRILGNDYLLFIGIAYLFISSIDLLHTMTYQGMGVFPGEGSNTATQLWLGARYLESATLLLSPVFLRRRLRPFLELAFYAAITTMVLLAVFGWRVFPDSFVNGRGLTPFKIYSEYAVCAFLAGALWVLYLRRSLLSPRVFRLMLSSITVTVASELFFTVYAGVYDTFNLLGHLLKIVSFYLIYKALIEEGLSRPYGLLFRDLKRSEEALRESEQKLRMLIEHSPVGVYLTDTGGRCRLVNERWCAMTGVPRERAAGLDWFSVLHPGDLKRVKRAWDAMVRAGSRFSQEYRVLGSDGETFRVAGNAVALRDRSGKVSGCLVTATDITGQKELEARLEELNETLELRVRERTAEARHRAAQLQAMALELAQAEQRERRRLAEVLHDHLQQLLVGAKLRIGLLKGEAVSAGVRQSADLATELLDQSIEVTRSLTVELSPPVLYSRGLVSALHWLAGWVEEKHGVRVAVRVDSRAEPETEKIRVILFQAVRELLFNAVKHAKAGRVSLSADLDPEGLIRIVVSDRGVGFDPGGLDAANTSPRGFGLFGIRERLHHLGGTLEVRSAPGEGSMFTLVVPVRGADSSG